jgi:hypothetical protein
VHRETPLMQNTGQTRKGSAHLSDVVRESACDTLAR